MIIKNAFNQYDLKETKETKETKEIKETKTIRNVILATTLSVAAILWWDYSRHEIKVIFSETSIESPQKEWEKQRVKKSWKNLWETILDEYEIKKWVKKESVKQVEEETQGIVAKVLSYFGYWKDISNIKPQKTWVDMYMLSKIAKTYLDMHKVNIIWENNGKAILVAYYNNPASKRGNIIFLPIPRLNPINETLQVTVGRAVFYIMPNPKANGYNTEYQITSTGWKWEIFQLAILYPTDSIEYNKQENKVDTTKSSISEIEWNIKISKKNKKVVAQLREKQYSLKQSLHKEEKQLKKLQKYEYFSYIPFTEMQNTEENRERGLSYLISKMKGVYELNFWKKVAQYGSSIPWLTIKEAIPPNFPLVLNIIERMDFLEYFEEWSEKLKDEKVIQELMIAQINRSLTTFWLNQSDAFNRQKSRVGATWVGQIMPWTYNLYRKHEKYGRFLPEENFQLAARNHDTSFLLQISHFDDQIHQFPEIIKQNWWNLLSNPKTRLWISALLAAGYNGNMKRIMNEVFWNIDVNDYKQRLTPHAIMLAMKKHKDKKIWVIQGEINELDQKIIKWNKVEVKKGKIKDKWVRRLSQSQIQKMNAEIKQKQVEIQAIQNTYKESMTYVLKTQFVVEYLAVNYPQFNGI